jgi:hypothetical protein
MVSTSLRDEAISSNKGSRRHQDIIVVIDHRSTERTTQDIETRRHKPEI